MLVQIRITLPEAVEVAIIKTGVAIVIGLIDSAAAARKAVTITHRNRSAGLSGDSRCPVTLSSAGLTPGSLWIPMPGFNSQLCPQSVAQWPQPRRQHLLNILRREHLVYFALFVAVDRRAEGTSGNKAV